MTYRLELTDEARLDVQEAWLWYENLKANLGEEFLLSLEASLNEIERNPLLYQIYHNNSRIALLKRFPYKAIYVIENSIVGVIAVIHNKRDPSIWMVRM